MEQFTSDTPRKFRILVSPKFRTKKEVYIIVIKWISSKEFTIFPDEREIVLQKPFLFS